jgi:hypothetical protein
MKLAVFIGEHRDELIKRCGAKVADSSAPPLTQAETDHGVRLFLDQLCEELLDGTSKTHEITQSAMKHGHELWLRQLTISQVVHSYGDVCQSVTDLAAESGARISTNDFRTMNRCLDDAIAGAVTAYGQECDLAREGESHELRGLVDTAIMTFEVLRACQVGVGGNTGKALNLNLQAIRAHVDRPASRNPWRVAVPENGPT